MQYDSNTKKEDELQEKATDRALDAGAAGKPQITPQNPAGSGFTKVKEQDSLLGAPKTTNPAASWEDSVLDDGLSKGDSTAQFGVRKSLENDFRVDSHRIGYDGKHVTLDGARIVTPADNRDGTTYVHSQDEIVRGLTEHARANGQVAIRDYVNSRGVPMDIEWNGDEGTVSINGVSVKPTYVIDGKAYIPRSQLDDLIGASEKQMGVRTDTDILRDARANWGDDRDAMAHEIMDAGSFRWNPEEDAAYQEWRRSAEREIADEYAQNMAMAKFRTGGVISPAAMQAAGNVRKRAVDDLATYGQQYEDRAYSKWEDDLARMYDKASMAGSLMQSDYNMESGSNDKVTDAWYRNKEYDWGQDEHGWARDEHDWDMGARERESVRDADQLETDLMDGQLYRDNAPGIYANERAISDAEARSTVRADAIGAKYDEPRAQEEYTQLVADTDSVERANAIGAKYDEPMMQEAYSQAVGATKAQELANLMAEKNLSWSDLLNMADIYGVISTARINEAKNGVTTNLPWDTLVALADNA